MSALLKVYSDALHTSELAHAPIVSTTTAGGTQNAGTSSLQVASTTNLAAQGVIDIDSGANLETIPYTSIIDSTHIQLARVTTINHASGVAVVSWFYALPIGDQALGIVNDGSQAAPTSSNVSTYYAYNAGDQTATFCAFSVSSASPATQNGANDTLISITSSSAGFVSVVTPANMATGATQQIWVVEEIALGQSNIPSTGQIGVLNLQYQSV